MPSRVRGGMPIGYSVAHVSRQTRKTVFYSTYSVVFAYSQCYIYTVHVCILCLYYMYICLKIIDIGHGNCMVRRKTKCD